MYTFLIIIHLLVSFIMIGAILLQSGKGAEIGAAFGGSSQTIFGSRGAATFLSKMTVAAAIVFMLTSLSLALLSKERSLGGSVMKMPKTEAPPSSPTASVPISNPLPVPAAPTGSPASPAPTVSAPPSLPSVPPKTVPQGVLEAPPAPKTESNPQSQSLPEKK